MGETDVKQVTARKSKRTGQPQERAGAASADAQLSRTRPASRLQGAVGAGVPSPGQRGRRPGTERGRGIDGKSAQLSTQRTGRGWRVHGHGLAASLQEPRGTLQGFQQATNRKMCFKKIILAVVWRDGKCEERTSPAVVSAEGSLDRRDTVNRAVDTRSEVTSRRTTSRWQDFVTDRMGRGGELGPGRLPSFQYVQLDAGGATDSGEKLGWVVTLTQIMFETPLRRAERVDLRSGFKDPERKRKVCARNTDLDVIGIHVAQQAKGVDDITYGSSVDRKGAQDRRGASKRKSEEGLAWQRMGETRRRRFRGILGERILEDGRKMKWPLCPAT